MYRYFGVKIYTTPNNHLNYSYTARDRNVFATGLNTRHKLAKVLVVLVDDGILPKHDIVETLISWYISRNFQMHSNKEVPAANNMCP